MAKAEATETTSRDVLKALQAAVKGLTFPSEANKPVKAVLWEQADLKSAGVAVSGIHPVDEAELRAVGKVPDGATVERLTVDEFFAPVVAVQDWFGDTEKEQTRRFQALVTALKTQTTGTTAFRVSGGHGDTSLVDVFVVGHAANGDVIGVTTQLVET